MLTHHVDQANHLIELTISGSISRDELTKTLVELEPIFNQWDEIRILKRIDSFKGMELMAWIDDFKFAYENFSNYSKIKKVAIVSDKEWVMRIAELTKNFIPAEVKTFESEDIEQAREWLK